jgi:hypothetical protein
MQALLEKELARQGETQAGILEGTLPKFSYKNYTIAQNGSAMDLSFDRKIWNPDTLHLTGYLENIDEGGIVCDYFNNFRLFAYHNKIGIRLADGTIHESESLKNTAGPVWLTLSASGQLTLRFNNNIIVNTTIKGDLTKIRGGFVTCGKLQGQELTGRMQTYHGTISDLRFSMNTLLSTP